MTAKERKRLDDLERKVHDLETHQLHLSPYQCPYCKPWHYVPWHPMPYMPSSWPAITLPSSWPAITTTLIGTPQIVSNDVTVLDASNLQPMVDELTGARVGFTCEVA